MTLFDAFRYDGKRVLVVGGATGMGAAVAELAQSAGAEVVVMDFAEVTLPGAKAVHVNLADAGSIDSAVEAVRRAGARVVLVRGCRGRDAGYREDQLYWSPVLDRPAVGRRDVAAGFVHRVHLVGGGPWAGRRTCRLLREYLAVTDFDEASEWAVARGKADYMFSKQAVCAYVASQALPLVEAGGPDQRDLPGADGHAVGAGEQGDVAGVRGGLPGGGRVWRRRRRWSRRTRCCSCAVTRRRR